MVDKNLHRLNTKCMSSVKSVVMKYSHNKCSTDRMAVEVTGVVLNRWLVDAYDNKASSVPFEEDMVYTICHTLDKMIKKKNKELLLHCPPLCLNAALPEPLLVQQPKQTTRTTSKTNPVEHHQNRSREERLFARNRIPVRSLKGVKTIKLHVEEDEVVEIDMSASRIPAKDKFRNDVLGKNYFKVPFGKLTMRQRRIRMNEVSKLLLGCCIDRQEYKRDNDEYLNNNKELAVEILNLISGVQEVLENKMKIRFSDLETESMAPPADDGLIDVLNDKQKEHKLAVALLGETSSCGYSRLKSNLDQVTTKSFPSYYMLTKNRRVIESLSFNLSQSKENNNHEIINTEEENDDDDNPEIGNTIAQEIREETISENEEDLLRSLSKNKESINGARIKGDYGYYISLLENKHKEKKRIIKRDDNTIVIDSIDGAEHLRSKNSITSIISFSTSLMAAEWIRKKEVSAGSSLNILTWQQLQGTESWEAMMPAVEEYFTLKYQLRQDLTRTNRNNYFFYDLHDGKMLYLLTQHSLWNRKHIPFILCTCRRGEGVVDYENHQCSLKTHSSQVQSYERSRRRWDAKKRQESRTPATSATTQRKPNPYDVKAHMDWVDEKNDGCSHFGVHPNLLPRDGLRFDMFHLKCSVTKKLMSYVRELILNQSTNVIVDFSKSVLSKFWRDYHLYIWRNKKKFSSFLGNEIALFVANVDCIIKFFNNKLIPNPKILDICHALTLWFDIFKFLSVTYVEDDDTYLGMIEKYENNCKDFYQVGARTFLSLPGRPGSQETFYTHTLRYYVPTIARTTFKRHGTGIGIFTMQGFERRNKESKNCMKRFSNYKGNIVVTNMKRVWDIFEHDMNNV